MFAGLAVSAPEFVRFGRSSQDLKITAAPTTAHSPLLVAESVVGDPRERAAAIASAGEVASRGGGDWIASAWKPGRKRGNSGSQDQGKRSVTLTAVPKEYTELVYLRSVMTWRRRKGWIARSGVEEVLRRACDKKKLELQKKILQHRILFVQGETGAGKTTRTPVFIKELFDKGHMANPQAFLENLPKEPSGELPFVRFRRDLPTGHLFDTPILHHHPHSPNPP